MKRTFDTAGVLNLQQEILAMSHTDRLVSINFVLSDFRGFMTTYFDLRPSQVAYLYGLSAAQVTEMSIGIADSWNNDLAVNFQKDSSSAEEAKDTPKDIILSRYNSSSTERGADSLMPTGYFTIRIVYRRSAES